MNTRPWIIGTVATVAGLLLASPALAGGAHAGHAAGAKPASSTPAKAQRTEVTVTNDGYVPSKTKVKVGQPVTLVVTRTVERTCATDLVIKQYEFEKALPVNQPVEVTFTPTRPGKIRLACAMDMIAGELVAE